MITLDSIALSQALIRQASFSDMKDPGALDVLDDALRLSGFACHRITNEGLNGDKVENLYARFGTGAPYLCFAGHTDVVPVGDRVAWSVDPFAAEIKNGVLIGRGAVDMKTAIACWVVAAAEYLQGNKDFKGSLGCLIAGDEETLGRGTPAMLEWIKARGETIDACIVGEPTNPTTMGEMVKIGRRGSLSFGLTVHGKQGHVAYPDAADNPVTTLVKLLAALKKEPLDGGTEFFPPSNLEVVNVEVGNKAMNVIPARAKAVFNVRFNDNYTRDKLEAWVKKKCDAVASNYTLERLEVGSESFLTKPGKLSDIVQQAVQKVTGRTPELGTTGGTSDARFIKDACPVVECGLINKTAHHVDERIPVEDITALTAIYGVIIRSYFQD